MWSPESVPPDDPARQGDLLSQVPFPDAQLPLTISTLRGSANPIRTVAVKLTRGVVVSQCCDNQGNDYAVISYVQQLSGLNTERTAAIQEAEPTPSVSGYDLRYFNLVLLEGVLNELKANRLWAADLQRTVAYYGDCSQFAAARTARMTAQGRRLLRIKLSLLWSRVEQGDLELLQSLGIPPRPTRTA